MTPDLTYLGPSLPGVAREAVASWLSGEGYGAFAPAGPAAAVFVTLRCADGSLRGCVGSLGGAGRDVVTETARSAVLAATRDPRFEPVALSELAGLSVEVSVLEPEEPVDGLDALDPRLYGVVVRDEAGRQGLLLPDIAGVDDARSQVEIASRKAGIATGTPVKLSRFRVRKWTEFAGGLGTREPRI